MAATKSATKSPKAEKRRDPRAEDEKQLERMGMEELVAAEHAVERTGRAGARKR
jgi:hypothetical protein